MASAVAVSSVRRASSGDTVRYSLVYDGTPRKLTLYQLPGFSAAGVFNERGQPLAILFAIHAIRKQPERRVLIRFGDRDAATTAILKPKILASLKLPSSQTQPHWKNSPDFALNQSVPRTRLVKAPPGKVVARQSLEEMICNPSTRVKMNSALNACFRALCRYIRCKKTNRSCFVEAQTASAFCFSSGDSVLPD
jgi:hypothetical protein